MSRFPRFLPDQDVLGRNVNLILDILDGGQQSATGGSTVAGSPVGPPNPNNIGINTPAVVNGFVPTTPVGLTGYATVDNVAQTNNGAVLLTWNPNPPNDVVVDYDVQWRKATDTATQQMRVGGGQNTVKMSALFTGQTYQFSVRAISGWNNTPSLWSAEISVAIPRDVVPPAVPSGLTAYSTPRGAAISWTPNTEADLQSYILQVTTNGGTTWNTISSQIFATSYIYTLSAASVGASLQFRVAAQDWSGNSSAYSAASTAKVVDGIKFDELIAGNLTVLGTITGSGGITTRNGGTGAGVTVDATGVKLYNSSNTNTVNLDASTGNAFFQGAITTGSTITLGSGNSVFKADGNGIYLGNATFASSPFRVDMAGNLTVASATVTGGSVVIGASPNWVNVNSSGIWAGGATFGASPFSVSPSGALVASSATITGAIQSGSTISGTAISGGSLVIGTSPNWVNINSSGIWAGGTTFANSPFSVDPTGALKATNATISGTVTGGTFVGATIKTSTTVDSTHAGVLEDTTGIYGYDGTGVDHGGGAGLVFKLKTDGTSFFSGSLGNNIVQTGNIANNAVGTTQLATQSVTAAILAAQIGGGNLLLNSSFEDTTGTNSWITGGDGFNINGGATLTRDTTHVYHGSYAGKVVTDGTATYEGVWQSITLQPNTKYTLSAWVYGDGVNQFGLVARDFTNSIESTFPSTWVATTSTWTRLVAYITTGASAATVKIAVRDNTGTTSAKTFWVDAIQCEVGDYPTAYAPKVGEILPTSVTTSMIAANAITTGLLAANAVTQATIANNAVGTAQIAANAVTTGLLAANAVTNAQLASNSVATGNIQANAITSSLLANGAVVTAALAANAVTQSNIASGAVGNAQIAAAAVQAGNLAVTIGGGNQVNNSGFEDFTTNPPPSWAKSGANVTIASVAGLYSPTAASYTSTTAGNNGTSRFYTTNAGILPSTKYTVSFWARRFSGTGTLNVSIDNTGGGVVTFTPPDNTTWVRSSATVTTASNSSAQIAFWLSVANDVFYIDNVQIELGDVLTAYKPNATEVLTGTIATANIANNAITTALLANNAVTQAQIASGAVGTAQVAANAITTGLMAANAVTNAILASNSVATGNIQANAVGTGQLALGAVDSTILASNAVTQAKIAAAAVGTAQIANNAVTTGLIAANAVGTGQLALLAVDSTILAANAVTQAKIAAAAVGNAQIAAAAVQAGNLAVTIGGGNLSANSSFEDTTTTNPLTTFRATIVRSTAVTPVHGTYVIAATSVAPSTQMELYADTSGGSATFIACRPSTVYTWSIWVRSSLASIGVQAYVYHFQSDGTTAATGGTNIGGGSTVTCNNTGWTRISHTFTSGTNAAYIRGSMWVPSGLTAGDIMYLDAVQMESGDVATSYAPKTGEILLQSVTGTQLVNNTITATQIAASTITAAQIASGTITAGQIAAGTITTTQIASGTIVAGNIAAGTITGTQIAATTISASNIVSGTITTSQIAASTITGGNIAATTITAGNIAASTITASQIAASTITTSQIAAGTITGGNIAASTITGSNVAATTISAGNIVSGTITTTQIAASTILATNIASNTINTTNLNVGFQQFLNNPNPLNALRNAGFEAPTLAYWSIGNAASAVIDTTASDANTGAQCIDVTYNSGVFGAVNQSDESGATLLYEVPPGATLYFGGWAYLVTAGAQTVGINLTTYDKNKAAVTYPGAGSGTVTLNTWVKLSGTYTVGATEKYVSFYLSSGNQVGASRVRYDDLFMTVQVPGVGIVANSITAGQIQANTITATQIAAATITTSQIAAGTITGGNIAASTITGSNVAATTISAGNIVSGTITTNQIAASTITGGNIAGTTITASNLVAGTITANEIASATITGAKIAAGTITASNITSGTITTTQIAAGTIVASNIASGTITGTQIAATTISAGNIVANTITAGQIQAGTITATELASGSVTTTKLNVTMGGANQFQNSSFEDDSGNVGVLANKWSPYNNGPEGMTNTVVSSGALFGGKFQRSTWTVTNTSTKGIYSTAGNITWLPNTTYVVSWYAKSPTVALQMSLAWNTSPTTTVSISNPVLSTSWQRYAFRITWGASVDPSCFITINGAGPNGGSVDFDGVQAEIGDVLTAYAPATNEILTGQVTGGASGMIAQTTITGGNIVTGTITATQIAATTITGDRLVGNTITAAQIAAGTITANEIAATTITGAKIAATTISAGNIVANTITSAQIAANTITAGQIQAGTITATEIAGSTITGAKIAGTTITAGNLAAGAVTTDKLTVGSFQDSAIPNGSFEDGVNGSIPTSWTATGGSGTHSETRSTTFAQDGSAALAMQANLGGSYARAESVIIPVTPGDVFYASVWYRSDTAITSGVYLRLAFGTTSSFSGDGTVSDVVQNVASTTSFQQASGLVTVPATFTWMKVILYNYQPNVTSTVYYDNVQVRKAVGTANIVDASIVNAKIANLDAGKINAGTITGIAYNNGSGTFAVTAGGAVTASNVTITGGSLTIGANFAVTTGGALTASSANITGTINANAGTFSGTITASGTISGGTLSGATITGGTITIGTVSNQHFKADTNGIYLGNDTFGSAPFRVDMLGNLTATSVTITGAIQNGSTMTGTTITGGSLAIGSANAILKADANGMYLGNATFASAPFRVDMNGNLTATSATITGTINASGGTFSGSITASGTITGGTIVSGDFKSASTVGVAGTTGSFELDTTYGLRFWDNLGNLVTKVGLDGTYAINSTNGANLNSTYLASPASLTLARVGGGNNSGAVKYFVTAYNSTGETAAVYPYPTSITTNSVLDGTHYVTLTWTKVAGATGYRIYRGGTAGITTPAVSVGKIADLGPNVVTYNDQGVAGDNVVPSEPATPPGGRLGVGIGSPQYALHVVGNNGLTVEGANLQQVALTTPGAPTVTATGVTGSTTYTYHITADTGYTAGMRSLSGPSASTTIGNATLSSSNYNLITWAAVPSAKRYLITRDSSTGGLSAGALAVIDAGATLSYRDIGVAVEFGLTFASTIYPTATFAGTTTINGAINAAYSQGTVATTGWGTVPVLISVNEPNSDVSSITFSSITSNFTSLQIRYSTRSDQATTAQNLYMRFNGDTAANYTWQLAYSGTTTSGTNNTQMQIGWLPGTSIASSWGSGEISINQYTQGDRHKSAYGTSVNANAGSTMYAQNFGGVWANTGAVSSITIFPVTGNLKAFSIFELWGIP